uniref:Uncharacterized protein n=1 Tax=Anguilla anguilla TaxID=7936 RepID=A0A0E9W098_ANGAN
MELSQWHVWRDCGLHSGCLTIIPNVHHSAVVLSARPQTRQN